MANKVVQFILFCMCFKENVGTAEIIMHVHMELDGSDTGNTYKTTKNMEDVENEMEAKLMAAMMNNPGEDITVTTQIVYDDKTVSTQTNYNTGTNIDETSTENDNDMTISYTATTRSITSTAYSDVSRYSTEKIIISRHTTDHYEVTTSDEATSRSVTSTPYPIVHTTTTKVIEQTGTKSNSSTTVSTGLPAVPSDPPINSTNPSSETSSGETHDPGNSTITTATTATETEPQGDTYVGFVVDDTGSMSVEIDGVKKWITSCVDGSSTYCGNPPTGGWVTTSFNDPTTGIVVGPTLNIRIIIDEVDRYYAHSMHGNDCPELGFTGLKNAVNVIPKVNSGCKIYFFTDATAKDSDQLYAVTKLYQDKGCSFIPLLTGCCGPCPAVCDTVDPDYYNTHVTDHTGADSTCSTRIARSVSANIQTLFYTLSEETGGSIYVTDKPRSSDEMLEFLEEEVTLGFCGTSVIAGPSPDGYKCEKDCSTMKMCWDRGVSKCYCNDTSSCRHDPVSSGYSRCEGEQVVECKSNEALQIIPDQNNCTRYFQCNSGNLHHLSCAPGTVFSVASTSYCDHPYNVPLPCGTYVPEEDDIM